jgi:hypothetical protein
MTSRVLAAVAIASACAIASSCTALLGLDGYNKAAESLCNKLESCDPGKYGDCKSFVSSGLDNATAGARQTWLTDLTKNQALDSCSAARAALDSSPVCHDAGSACTLDAHCCGFNGSLATCNIAKGSCCRSAGATCASNSECCNDVGCTDDGTGTKTCGGSSCVDKGGACTSDGECCSSKCDKTAKKCVAKCIDTNSQCTNASDCCTEHCSDNVCVCLADGASCLSSSECCKQFLQERQVREGCVRHRRERLRSAKLLRALAVQQRQEMLRAERDDVYQQGDLLQ